MSCSLMMATSAVSKPVSRPQDGERRSRASAAPTRPARRRRCARLRQPVVGQHMAHAVARALAPGGDDDALARALQRARHASPRPRRRWRLPARARRQSRGPGRPPISTTFALPSGAAKGVSSRKRRCRRAAPFHSVSFEIEAVGRQRLVGRPHAPRVAQCLAPRLVIVLDLRRSRSCAASSASGSSTTADARHVIEQRIQPLVEQRQPMLHAGMAAAFAHRLIERIVAVRRAEGSRHSPGGSG